MIVGLDFDGTCVTHEYPHIGKDIGAVPVLKGIVEQGDLLILYTMRDGDELEEAKAWFKQHGIPLFAVNNNPKQASWTTSPKLFANLYIDDAALGAPLIKPENGDRPYLDWEAVAEILGVGECQG